MLVLASGRGTRFGGDIPKVYLRCGGITLLEHGLQRLAQVADDSELILAVNPQDRRAFVDPLVASLRAVGVRHIVDGGSTRQASMRAALAASSPSAPLVLVHDAARPLVPIAATRAALQRAETIAGVTLAIPVADTLKRADDSGRVLTTLDRTGAWQAQTPQIVQRDKLLAALALADRDGFEGTDDVSLLEHAGFQVALIPGTRANIKLTHAEDLAFVAALLQAESMP